MPALLVKKDKVMSRMIPTKVFFKEVEAFASNQPDEIKTLIALAFLQENPFHPGFHLERIINDPTAWAVRSTDATASPLTLSPTIAPVLRTGTKGLSFSGYLITTTCTKSQDKNTRKRPGT